jgi:periplasmic mercuric ion binding protein
MKKLISLTLLVLSFASGAVEPAAQTLRAAVNGMVCAFCAQGIEKKLRSMRQTEDVFVDLKHKLVAVQVKAGQSLSPDTLRDLIKDAGYDVSSIETIAATVQSMRAPASERD